MTLAYCWETHHWNHRHRYTICKAGQKEWIVPWGTLCHWRRKYHHADLPALGASRLLVYNANISIIMSKTNIALIIIIFLAYGICKMGSRRRVAWQERSLPLEAGTACRNKSDCIWFWRHLDCDKTQMIITDCKVLVKVKTIIDMRYRHLLMLARLASATCFACVVLVELGNLLANEVGDIAVPANSFNRFLLSCF